MRLTIVLINSVMKLSRFIYAVIAAVMLSSAPAAAQEVDNLPFKSGEKLTFILNYTWGGVVTDVGTATCELKYADGVYHPVLIGKTYKFYDFFFKVRERFESKFDASTLRPVYFFRSAQEGKYRIKNSLTFNDSDYTITSRTQKYDRTPVDTLLKATENTYDLISLFFKSRTMDVSKLPVEEKVPLDFAIDKEVYNLYFIYKGRENKKIPGMGTFKTLKFAAKVVAGNIFDGKEDMLIWVSDDKNMIPLFFESPILIGRMQGRISKIENNKYPLSSKIK